MVRLAAKFPACTASEKVTTIEAADNACSGRQTTTVKRRGRMPLFGGFLMNFGRVCAWKTSRMRSRRTGGSHLGQRTNEKVATDSFEDDVREARASRERIGGQYRHERASAVSDRPGLAGNAYGFDRNPETGRSDVISAVDLTRIRLREERR
jgi:hypothetical protein